MTFKIANFKFLKDPLKVDPSYAVTLLFKTGMFY